MKISPELRRKFKSDVDQVDMVILAKNPIINSIRRKEIGYSIVDCLKSCVGSRSNRLKIILRRSACL